TRNCSRRVAPASVGCKDRAAFGWRETPRRTLPLIALQAGHAAARRTDEPPRCRKRRLARTVLAALSGHGRRGNARSLLPRQRRGVDSRTRPRARNSVEGQLQFVARSEA